jgi:AraC family transcriptional regulator
MMTTPPSTFVTPVASSEVAPLLWRAAHQDLLLEGPLEKSEISSNLASALLPDRHLFNQTVEISPIDAVRRHSTGRYGIVVESIYASIGSRIQIDYNGPVHLLVLYEDGARRDGETSIEGLPPSRLRKLANKLTFVPAGHSYREWHVSSTAVRVTYLYLSPAKIQTVTEADAAYVPKVLFEDSTLWATVMKLKAALESNNGRTAYLEALINVLAHELSCSGEELTRALPPNRGGLASWQIRAVISYIEEHLNEQISLVTLARLARLSQHHFCRAFKQSFGIPPHGYHLQRRMQQAKVLLSDRATSITEVGLISGYANSSSFSLTFRKITGQTPSQFRRNFK